MIDQARCRDFFCSVTQYFFLYILHAIFCDSCHVTSLARFGNRLVKSSCRFTQVGVDIGVGREGISSGIPREPQGREWVRDDE